MTDLDTQVHHSLLLAKETSAKKLMTYGGWLAVIAFFEVVVGAIAGIAVAASTNDDGTHSLVGAGIGLIIASVITFVFLQVAAWFAKAYAAKLRLELWHELPATAGA